MLELRQGIFASSRETRVELYLLQWLKTGRLYSEAAERRTLEAIRDDYEKNDIPLGVPDLDVTDGNSPDRCEDEVRYQRSVSDETYTFEEIGEQPDFCVSRERVRQIMLGALRKLESNETIRELWYGYPQIIASAPRPPTSVNFYGCRCRRWDSVVPNVIYCRACGQTWKMADDEIRKLKLHTMLDRATTIEDEES